MTAPGSARTVPTAVKPPFIRWFAAASCVAAAALAAPSSAFAQAMDDEGYEVAPSGGDAGFGFGEEEEETPSDPLRILGTLTFGTSIRFIQDLDYYQDRFAPAYLSGWGGVVLPGSGIRHALGVTASLNVTGDGNAMVGVDAGTQFVVGPSYGLYIPVGDFLLLPKFSVPIAVSSGPSLGLGLSLGAAYRFLAGFGIYAELGASMFFGTAASVHPLGSGEIGLIIDYEVLP